MKLFVGMKAVIVREDGKVLVLREAKYDEGTDTGKWDIPGGRIEPGESIYDALKREVREESGLEIEFVKTLGVFEAFIPIKGESCHIVRVFNWCNALTEEVRLSADHDQYEWVDPHNLDEREYMSSNREMIGEVAKMLS